MASSDSVTVGEEEILYIISNIFAKPQVFYYLVSDAKIFDIIYQLSPLLESPLEKLDHHRATGTRRLNPLHMYKLLMLLSDFFSGFVWTQIPAKRRYAKILSTNMFNARI